MAAYQDPFSTPRQTPVGYSNPDLDNFYSGGIPPAHRLSDNFISSSPGPHAPQPVSYTPADAATRGAYEPAATSTEPANMSNTYRDIDTNEAQQAPYQWQEKASSSGGARRKWMIAGGIVGLLALIGIGVGVGVGVSSANRSSKSTASTSSSSSSSSSSVTGSNPDDPSQFTKDSRLKQSFYGIAYTPEGSQLPNCGNNLTDVITDIQLLSQLTTRIRLYGADCNQSALVLEAIKQTKVDMQVYLGNYPDPADGGVAYARQRDLIIEAIKTYGTDHIAGVTVGNEFMLNYLNDHGSTSSADANSTLGNAGAAVLLPNITDTRSQIQALSLSKTIPIGNAEAGAYFNNEILEAVDYGMSNVHPWFAAVSIDQAAGWTAEYFEETNVAPASALSNKPTMYIAETGWPTASDSTAAQTNGPSQANTTNLQEFLDTFVCQANVNNTGYFFFEYFDETWKAAQFGGVEGHWGLFYSNRTLKDITIPSC